jgi:hypothetical protein
MLLPAVAFAADRQSPEAAAPAQEAAAAQPAGAAAPAAAAAAAAAVAPQAKAKPVRICKGAELTGSRLSKGRVCKTREEWDRIARKSKDGTEELVRRALDGQSNTSP